jgi:hypothetical protein
MPRPAIYRATESGVEYWRGVKTAGKPGPDLNLGAVDVVTFEQACDSYLARLRMNRNRWRRELKAILKRNAASR